MELRRLAAWTLALAPAFIASAWANPTGGSVVAGQAIINNQGNLLTIVNTPGSVINWQGFSIAPGEITRFVQQDGSSAVLNRIVGQDPSLILGALQSNGHVFLVNPNGIVFGAGARVDVNGIVASSLDIANDDFRAGHLKFDARGTNPGAVRNDGTITTPSGGRVYLIAPSVENSGLIASPEGDVVLAAGREVQLVDSRNPDLHVVVSAPQDRALNVGEVVAHGGSIGIYGALVNQRGVVDADSAIVGQDGRIVFKASDTTLLEAGSTTTARGAGSGGSIHVLGDHVGLTDDAKVDASGKTGGGTVLVGGDYHGGNAAIQNASATYVGAQTSIRADATDSGNGGRVIVWSNGATRAYGQISARGGAASGDGGFAEVSGASYLDYRGRTDLRAGHGNVGELLLDPNDITIQSTGTSDVPASAPPVTFSGGPATSILTTADLAAQLASGNVTVSTAGGSGGPLGGHITVASPLAWNGGALTLDADNGIAINGTLTNQADGRLILVNRGGSITQTAAIDTTYLAITSLGDVNLTATNGVGVISAQVGDGAHLNQNFRFTNGGSFLVSSINGLSGISIATSGGYSASAPDGVIALRATNGDITQLSGSVLDAKAVSLLANNVNLPEANGASVVAGALTGGAASNNFTYTTGGTLTVGVVGGRTGIQAGNGDVSLTSIDGNMALTSPVQTGGGVVNLAANVGSISGAASGLGVTASAGNGISLTTNTQTISAVDGGATSSITIANGGPLIVTGAAESGSGAISITASGALTVNGLVISTGGPITLAAGPTGSTSDVLTVNGAIDPVAGPGVAVSTSGPVLLRAGDAINVNGTVAGSVSQQAFINVPPLPSLAQCTVDPTLSGCDQVLPSLSQCIASAATAGCSAVLPTLAQCTANPSLSGCGAVLPTLAQCVASPSLAGCAAVLPSIAVCTATPSMAGCSVVLPTVGQCIASPASPGCAAVLPTLSQCVATPATSGCSAVLPTLAACTATPSLPGCSVILPTLAQCTATPTLQGCAAVLPTLATCIATPTLSGCMVVLPPPSACLASAAPGCSVVLPPIVASTQEPIGQAINSTVNLINRTTSSTSSSTSGSASGSTSSNPPDNKKPDDQGNALNANDSEAKNEQPAKKMYCN